MNSYDVRFWDIRKIGDTAKGRWRVRWAVAGREHCKSFPARPLADGFLASLKDAVRDRQPFDPATGLPAAGRSRPAAGDCHLVRARPRLRRRQMAAPGPHLPPVGRRGADHRHRRAGPRPARRPRPRAAAPVAVRLGVQPRHPQPHPARRDRQRAGLDRRRVAARRRAGGDAATIRLALDACARTLAGKPAAATTQRRKRAVFHNAVSYAVELRLLDANPVDRIQWKAPAVAQTVDRRVVAGPAQVRGLLAAVRGHSDRGEHLEAFYGCLYYAYLRPSEAVMLRESRLPAPRPRLGPHRPGRLRAPRRQGLDRRRHRPPGPRPQAPRPARNPVHPHPARPGPDAPRPPQAVRHRARRADLPHRPRRPHPGQRLQRRLGRAPAPPRSPPPSTPPRWPAGPTTCGTPPCPCALNAGVPATEVARRAGHSVAVLLKIYAHCIDGQADAANKRIADALDEPGSD